MLVPSPRTRRGDFAVEVLNGSSRIQLSGVSILASGFWILASGILKLTTPLPFTYTPRGADGFPPGGPLSQQA